MTRPWDYQLERERRRARRRARIVQAVAWLFVLLLIGAGYVGAWYLTAVGFGVL